MIFTVYSFLNLEALTEIDDYISAVWNNKFYTAGEFEIVMKTTKERTAKLIRNNYIALNGTDEIAVIEFVQFSQDEEKGAIMTVKGSFAQSLLKRRIIWDKVNINGNVETQLRKIIENNALAPADPERYLTLDMVVSNQRGKTVTLPEYLSIKNIQMVGDTYISNSGTPDNGRLSNFSLTTSKLAIGQIVGETQTDFTFTYQNGTAIDNLYSNPLDNEIKTTFYWDNKECKIRQKCSKYNIFSMIPEPKTTDRNLSWSYSKGSSLNVLVIAFDVGENVEDEKYLSNHFVRLTKDEFNNGGFGFAVFDDRFNFRLAVSASADKYVSDQLGIYQDIAEHDNTIYRLITGKWKTESGYQQFDSESWIMCNLVQFQEINITPSQAFDATKTTQFKLNNIDNTLTDYISVEFVVRKADSLQYFALGKKAGLNDNIELQLYGENLETKLEEILELYYTGIKCRADIANKKIYLDFYRGTDRSTNIVFSENLDNLNSYIVNIGNVEANVALVYSKITEDKEEIEYTGVSGVGSGIYRKEIFINKTDNAGYAGTDYEKQLIQEGTLSLQSLTLTIESEIDTKSYIYRTQFNLGDIVKIYIKDLDITYKARVLEVREYNDETGYSIDIVLGEGE